MALLSDRERRYVLVGFVSVALLAFLITLVVTLLSRGGPEPETDPGPPLPVLRVSDLEMPLELLEHTARGHEVTRSGVTSWDEALVRRFWVDQSEIVESLSDASEAMIRELFSRIP